MKEPSLVFFTVLLQAAAGFWTGLGLLAALLAGQGAVLAAERILEAGTLAVLPLILVGMLASFFHLGSPRRSYRAVLNLSSSWLAREILLAASFTGVSLAVALVQNLVLLSLEARLTAAWIPVLLGFGLVYSMSRVYCLRTVPAWNVWLTPGSFFLTAFLLGSLSLWVMISAAVGTISGGTALEPALSAAIPMIRTVALVLLSIQLLLTPLWTAHLCSRSVTKETLKGRLHSPSAAARSLRLGLLLSCLILLVAPFDFGYTQAAPGLGYLVQAGLILCLAFLSEGIGRSLFYSEN